MPKTKDIVFVNYILDNIHGFIGLTEIENRIERLPIFKRLQNISQLGLVRWVFPGATHSRYVHSLGVMHVADQMAIHLKFEPWERQIIRIAGLLHDLGHYPLSHDGETAYKEDPASVQADSLSAYRKTALEGIKKFTNDEISLSPKMVMEPSPYHHERVTVEVIKANTTIRDLIAQYVDCDIDDIAAIITGNCDRKSQVTRLSAMIQLMHSEIDADRIDYLLRDASFSGASYGAFNMGILLQSLDVAEHDGVFIVGVKPKGIACVEQFLVNRFLAYNQVIFHKYTSALGAMARISSQMMMRDSDMTGFLDKTNLLTKIQSRSSSYLSFTDHKFFQCLNSINFAQIEYPEPVISIMKALLNYSSLEMNSEFIVSNNIGTEINDQIRSSETYARLQAETELLYVFQGVHVTSHVPLSIFDRRYYELARQQQARLMQDETADADAADELPKHDFLLRDRLQHGAALIDNGSPMLLVDSDMSMLKHLCGVRFCVLREYRL